MCHSHASPAAISTAWRSSSTYHLHGSHITSNMPLGFASSDCPVCFIYFFWCFIFCMVILLPLEPRHDAGSEQFQLASILCPEQGNVLATVAQKTQIVKVMLLMLCIPFGCCCCCSCCMSLSVDTTILWQFSFVTTISSHGGPWVVCAISRIRS